MVRNGTDEEKEVHRDGTRTYYVCCIETAGQVLEVFEGLVVANNVIDNVGVIGEVSEENAVEDLEPIVLIRKGRVKSHEWLT